MKVSVKWLEEYLSNGIETGKLAEKLTMAGLEVVGRNKNIRGEIFDIEITPNRSDLLSILGVARETAAVFNRELNIPQNKIKVSKKNDLQLEVKIKDYAKCPLYTARIIKDVEIFDSPSWLRERLESVDLRKVNNVVDITNFCLFETGHPLHAFDYDKIEGKKIIVRNARQGEEILTIDEEKRILSPEDLIIADEEKPIAIAGIIGGKQTEVARETKNIVIESAFFDYITVRKTARRLGITTESSYRFERGVSVDMLNYSSDRASVLIKNLVRDCKIGKKYKAEKKENLPSSPTIKLDIQKVHKYLDCKIENEEVVKILESLDIKCLSENNIIISTPPLCRQDLKRDVDLIEEVARIYGYDKISCQLPLPSENDIFEKRAKGSFFKKEEFIKNILIGLGFNEIITYTLISKNDLEKISYPPEQAIKIKNPLSNQQEVLRPLLVPSIMKVIGYNLKQFNSDFRLFEIGKIYKFSNKEDVQEKEKLILAVAREQNDKQSIFYNLKGMLESFMESLGIKGINFKPAEKEEIFYPGACADIVKGKDFLGKIGLVLEEFCEKFDISSYVVLANLHLDKLKLLMKPYDFSYNPIVKFPSSYRDISLIVEKDIYYSKIITTILNTNRKIISNVAFIDKYEGAQIPAHKKSITCRIIYQASNRTLTDEEIELLHNKVVENLKKKLNATVR